MQFKFVCRYNVLLGHSDADLFICFFQATAAECVVVRGALGPRTPEPFTVWSFIEKVC